MSSVHARPSSYDVAAWILAGFGLLLVFPLHLFSALMAGLLVCELVHLAAPLLNVARISHRRAKMVVVGLLAAVIVSVLAALIWKAAVFFQSEEASLQALLKKMAEILDNVRAKVPAWALDSLPENVEDINLGVASMLREHAASCC